MLPVRSTVSTPPRIYMEVHAFNARTVSVDSTPASARPIGLLRWARYSTVGRRFSDTESAGNLGGLRSLEEVLEIAVFGKDVVEGLVYNIVCRCVNESGILIDLSRSCLIETN